VLERFDIRLGPITPDHAFKAVDHLLVNGITGSTP
jgi:hypothetical protein